ncbi:hypothetical protein SAMN04489732_11082 [Amycolatopsis saalfeldensis]|uniref:Polyketide cyclase / dehydrase and lipid transport n=1 Tax=Amycolatopsis saalfeldensis TaxID=394193 RepID=A0A1H8XZZ3_9PSEU|nr:hypothetical protein SAMN04489732_11082 [Amycolatopsis saalfeldensis]
MEVSGVVATTAPEAFAGIERWLKEHSAPAEADRERRTLVSQGGWWYRGEYHVTADPAGARVTHRVLNAAEGQWWAVLPANRFLIGFRPRVRAGFAALLAELDQGIA